ncbi:unknown [Bacteroides sp. CAG:754]|nr:unknown [Bacteroides sp. CAG:754]
MQILLILATSQAVYFGDKSEHVIGGKYRGSGGRN